MMTDFYSDSLLGRFERHARECPALTVYTYLGDANEAETLTCAQLAARVRTIAARLGERLKPGDRALLLYPQGLEFLCGFLGCLAAGVIAVPSYPHRGRRKSDRLAGIIADCSPAAALTLGSLRERVPHEFEGQLVLATDEWPTADWPHWRREGVKAETIAFLQYTSGSTGAAKGVMVTHGNIACNQRQIALAFGNRSWESGDDMTTIVSWLPMYHDMGLLGGALQPIHVGCPVVLLSPATFVREPVKWLEAVTKYKATTTGAPNFAYEHCVRSITDEQKRRLDLSSLRVLFNGAEPVRGDTLDRFAAAFASCGFQKRMFFPCYGLAEATLFVSGGPPGYEARSMRVDAAALEEGRIERIDADGPHRKWLVSCGEIAEGTEVVIVDPKTRTELHRSDVCREEATRGAECPHPSPVPEGEGVEVGEIWIKSGAVAAGYWNRPEDSQATFGNRLAHEGDGGFLATGDLGFIDAGQLYITGRLKDVIIVRGRNLYPQDIEAAVSDQVGAIGPNGCAAVAIDAGETEGVGLVVEADLNLARLGRTIADGNGDSAAARAELDKLVSQIRGRLSDEFETPLEKLVVVRPCTFPRTTSGKVRRAACREGLLAGTLEAIYSWEVGRVGIDHRDFMVGNAHPTDSLARRFTRESRERADEIIAWLRDYAGRKLNSRVIDERRCVPPHVVLDFGLRGLFGLQAPREYGGADLTTTDTLRVFAQLAAIDLTLCIMVGIHNGLGLRPLQRFGRTAEVSGLLPLVASGRQLAAFALTESAAGSNPNAIETTARRDSDGWVLRGEKRWIGLASWAGVITCFARALDAAGRRDGVVALAVREDTPGVRHGAESLTMGVRGIVQNRVFFDAVRVPDAFRLGEAGSGMTVAQDAMMFCRMGLAAVSVGGMKRCAQLAARYAARRMVATGRLIDNPLTISRVEDMVAAATACEALVTILAGWLDAGQDVPVPAYVACKTTAPELLSESADALMQLLGGRGYEENGPAPQLFRDARLLRIFEGPTETLNSFLGSGAFERGNEIAELIGGRLGQPRLAADLREALERTRSDRNAHLAGELASAAILAAAASNRAPSGDVMAEAARWACERFDSLRDAAMRSLGRTSPSSGTLLRHVARFAEAIGDVEQTLPGAVEDLDPLLRIGDQATPSAPALARVWTPDAGFMVGNAHPTLNANRDTATVGRLAKPSEANDGLAGRPTAEGDERVKAPIRAALIGWLRLEVGTSPEALGEDTPFTSLGLDSIGAATVALDIEKATGVRVSPDAIYQHPTVTRLAEYVAGHLSSDLALPPGRGMPEPASRATAVHSTRETLDGSADGFAMPRGRAPGEPPTHDYARLYDEAHHALTSGDEVSDAIWRFCAGLGSLRSQTSKAQWTALTTEYREHPLIALLHQDPWAARAFNKPRGYPGDAGVIDYVYRVSPSVEESRGLTPLGSAILKVAMEFPSAHAVRERKRLAARQIDTIAAQERRPTVMAVGAGHAREVALSAALREGLIGRFLAIDQDERSLAVIQREYGSAVVECLPLSVQDLLQGSRPTSEADLIYALGLYDYLSEAVAQRLTSALFDMLAPGGKLLIANFIPGIIEAGYMEAVSDWFLMHREPAELERLSVGLSGSRSAVWVDNLRCFAYLSVMKIPLGRSSGSRMSVDPRHGAQLVRERNAQARHVSSADAALARCGEFGCRINEISPAELFQHYRDVGFLYSAKQERLAPHFDEIIDNWRKASSAGGLLHWIVTNRDENDRGSASLTCWRTTMRGMFFQHLVSTGEPARTRDVLLGALAEAVAGGANDIAAQNWFREENRSVRRIFGGVRESVGSNLCASHRYALLDVPFNLGSSYADVVVRRGGPEDAAAIYRLALEARGKIYADAEELLGPDLELQRLNELYREAALFRYRKVWLASLRGERDFVAAALAYRGPLGLNFSFLENRCDLLVRPNLAEPHLAAVTRSLMSAVSVDYEDFSPGFVPTVADERVASALEGIGATLFRRYTQIVWRREAYSELAEHFRKVFATAPEYTALQTKEAVR